MSVSDRTQAVLLLTAHFGKPVDEAPAPLTPTEWGRFGQWLSDHSVLPETLLWQDPASALAKWSDRSITLERIQYLLGRAGALGLALERWERAGLWVLTRFDPDYPARLKKLLKADALPVFFGCGHRNLLNQGGIAVVGSRDASAQDLAFTSRLGGAAALQGLSVVSGGARGVDEAAMLGALEREGTVVGILSDSLLRAATSAKYRQGVMANNLVLISPFNPEAGFDVGNAMARNKYIYCLADAGIVIAAGSEKGGTWNGAIENLRNAWVPLWVKPHQETSSGNYALVERGARWLPENGLQFASLFAPTPLEPVSQPGRALFDGQAPRISDVPSTPPAVPSASNVSIERQPTAGTAELVQTSTGAPSGLNTYDVFLHRIEHLTAEKPTSLKQLLDSLVIKRSQLNAWLKRATSEGRVKKSSKPVRYQWASQQARQSSLFEATTPTSDDRPTSSR